MSLDDVADKIAIQELTARYNRAADSGDGDGFAATFTEDGVFVVRNGETESRREGKDVLREMIGGRPPGATVHVTADSIIEIDGDEARQWSTGILNRRGEPGTPISYTVGRYTDRLERRDGSWRFAERIVELDGANEGFLIREP
jgi:uncharacterized protein (TIGR02246 family)